MLVQKTHRNGFIQFINKQKQMNRNFLKMAFVSLFAVVALSSCDENEDENGNNGSIDRTIAAVVENGSAYDAEIDSVKVFIEYYGDYLETPIALAAYTNGQFTFTLPETVSDEWLSNIADDFGEDRIPNGVTVSDKDVKGVSAWIEAYHDGNRVGNFRYKSEVWSSYLVYADRKFSLTGSYIEEDGDAYKYNIHLGKGWNRLYSKETKKEDGTWEGESTTIVPAGLKWVYEEYENNVVEPEEQINE
jgi:hypothetical protein